MKVEQLEYNERILKVSQEVEEVLNFLVRSYDKFMGFVGLGGRKADYDDYAFEFIGGANDELRKKHYDKSLRLLWKAQQHASWSTFEDCTKEEKMMLEMADQAMDSAERKEVERLRSAEYRQFLNDNYTPEQKQSIVNILSLIGHGEAYAWLVSNELLQSVKSTGAKAALTMQVLEEAKHFVVLRELIYAFDVPVPRMLVFEYNLLESTYKARGLEKFFGMNVGVEGLALSIFGAFSKYPGLEVLRMFHRDEARHTALPTNYFKTMPMNSWEKLNPVAMFRRLFLILPALPIILLLEKDFAILGIDAMDFIGSTLRKVIHLAYRVGFYLPLPQNELKVFINFILNLLRYVSHENHEYKNFLAAETTEGEYELDVERKVFRLQEVG